MRLCLPLPFLLLCTGCDPTGSCFAWIHTHDTTGVVHVFTQVGKSDTLGQVFSVWGQPLGERGALGYSGNDDRRDLVTDIVSSVSASSTQTRRADAA